MSSASLPTSPEAFAEADWPQVAGYFDELEARSLEDDRQIESWLADWSALESLVSEAASRAMIAYTIDTGDEAKQTAHLRFSTEILPRMEERSIALARRFLGTGYTRPDLATTRRRFATQAEIFREANVPLFSELEELGTRYQRITGSMTVMWDGEERPLPQLQPFLKSPDRAVRESAFRAVNAPYVAQRTAMADLFDQMYTRRQQVAANAGFANFRDFIFPAKNRFDYTPADCERFHEAVEAVVVPAVERILAHRRERLGVSRLRPWDIQVDPYGSAVLRPFRTEDEFTAAAARVFERVDPVLGGEFGTMVEEHLLDLVSRKGKAPGGYCDTLNYTGRPFIFMNAVGVVDDVMTLLHEAGHAFHAFASSGLPLVWQRHPGSEAAELASMSMELLAAPHLGAPVGFFQPTDLRRATLEHLEDVLPTLAHIASVDAFQTWIYTSGEGADRDARDAAWLRIRSRFEQGVDWTGLESERVARWYRQLHIFLYPFYYIEYGIAQLGALQVWRNSLRDPAEAVRQYRRALSLGATAPLPEIYRAAGARLTFEVGALQELVELVEEQAHELREALPVVPAA